MNPYSLFVNACQAVKETGKDTACLPAGRGEIVIRAIGGNPPIPDPVCNQGDRPGLREGSVIIEIQDNGPGIPADKLKDVFRPFYTTKAEGTGLGLYITQQLVEKIRGRIHVQSEIGVGTTFTVSLPGHP